MSTLFVRFFALLSLVTTIALSPLAANAQPIGGPLQWQGNRPFWTDSARRRHFVTQQQAAAWYQQRDPQWWRAHQRDWRNNRAKFDRDWRSSHR